MKALELVVSQEGIVGDFTNSKSADGRMEYVA
jgi:hypothetical protein